MVKAYLVRWGPWEVRTDCNFIALGKGKVVLIVPTFRFDAERSESISGAAAIRAGGFRSRSLSSPASGRYSFACEQHNMSILVKVQNEQCRMKAYLVRWGWASQAIEYNVGSFLVSPLGTRM